MCISSVNSIFLLLFYIQLNEKAFELRNTWTDILSKAIQVRKFKPAIVLNQSEENSNDCLQEEGEGVSPDGESGEKSHEGVVSDHEVEGEFDEGEGIWSSGEDGHEACENENEEDNVDSQDIAQKKDKEQPGVQGRAKRECPVLYCKKMVVHIPRHLVHVHHWSPSQSRSAVTNFNLRKKYTFKNQMSAEAGNRKRKQNGDKATKLHKDYHKKRICPVMGCSACVKRLPAHLKKVHEISPSTDEYKRLLKKALPKRKRPYSVLEIENRVKEEFQEAAALSKGKRPYSPLVVAEGSDEDAALPKRKRLDSDLEVDEGADEDVRVVESVEAEFEDDNTDPSFILTFSKWLQSPDGGKKDTKTAKQHSSQINRILSVIDTDKKVESLLDLTLLKEKFVTQAEEKYLPETIKSYFTSLKHFCSFLLSERPKDIEVKSELVTQVREKVKRWSSSYKRLGQKRMWERSEEDRLELITPEKIEAFEKSPTARDAIILLGKLSSADNVQITQSQYTLLRDFLLVQISIDNANRAGVLSNMTLREFNRASVEDGRFLISVMDHKTFHIHGPAQVVLTSALHNWMKIFVQEVRSKVPGVGTEEHLPVFPSFNGTKLQSCQINKAIKSVWKKAGITGPIHSTLLRKGAVTAIHKNKKEAASDLADLMAHKEATAVKYYRLTEKAQASVKASQVLHSVMRKRSSAPSSEISKELSEKTEDGLQKRGIEEQADEELQNSANNSPSKLHTPWSSEAIQEIQNLFEGEIQQKKVSIDCVKERIKCSKILQGEDSRRVYDRVRAEWRHPASRINVTAELPAEKEELSDRVNRLFRENTSACCDIIPPTTLSNTAKALFSEEQVQLLHRLFQDMIKNSPISRKVILERLSSDVQGKEMLKGLSIGQLVNRIKYERRQKREMQA